MHKDEEISLVNVNEQSHSDNNLPNTPNVNTRFFICFKIIVVIFMILIIVINSVYGVSYPKDHPTCFKDITFKLTNSINFWFASNETMKNFFKILSSVSMDVLGLTLFAIWSYSGGSWRLILSLIMYYSLRILCFLIYQFKVPEGYQWEHPGFPSIFVSYNRTNDFFFSSFIGVTLIFGLEFYKHKYNSLFVISLVLVVFQFLLTTFLRANYFIDNFAGVAFAHYSFLITDDFLNKFENKIVTNEESINTEEKEKKH